jgi:hypothetical protein
MDQRPRHWRPHPTFGERSKAFQDFACSQKTTGDVLDERQMNRRFGVRSDCRR